MLQVCHIDRYIPCGVGHCADQCGARSGSSQLWFVSVGTKVHTRESLFESSNL